MLVAIAAVTVALIWESNAPDRSTLSPSTPSARSAGTLASSEGTKTVAAPPPSASVRPLQGRDLAVAWLRGYLTRTSREDDRWEAAIAEFSTPELVDELREYGPDSVGLDELTSWRVAKIKPYKAVDRPVDTASRKTLTYTAFVTDGYRTVAKPFTLYVYRQVNDRWLVTLVEQPYSSEG